LKWVIQLKDIPQSQIRENSVNDRNENGNFEPNHLQAGVQRRQQALNRR
jgi:hypothetical protein